MNTYQFVEAIMCSYDTSQGSKEWLDSLHVSKEGIILDNSEIRNCNKMSRPSAKKTNRLENKRLNELNKKASRAQGYKVLEKRSIFSEDDDSENERKDELDLEESDGRNYSEPDDNVVMTHEGNENENKKGAERNCICSQFPNITEEDIRKLQMILDLAKAINPEVLKDLDNINKKAGFTKNREFRLTYEQYTAVITSKCATLRNPKGKKGTNICMANSNSTVKSSRRSLSQKTKFHSNQTNSSFKNMTEGSNSSKSKNYEEEIVVSSREDISSDQNTEIADEQQGSSVKEKSEVRKREGDKNKQFNQKSKPGEKRQYEGDQQSLLRNEKANESKETDGNEGHAKEKHLRKNRESEEHRKKNSKHEIKHQQAGKSCQNEERKQDKERVRHTSERKEPYDKERYMNENYRRKSSEPIFEKQRDGVNEVNKERRQNREKSLEKVGQKSERKESDGTERHEKEQHGKKDTELLVESRRSDGKGLYEEKKIDRKKSEGSDGKIGAKEYRKNRDEVKSKSDDKKKRHEEEQQRRKKSKCDQKGEKSVEKEYREEVRSDQGKQGTRERKKR
ncbi:histone-lysine N-methyltransferase, H3 lysine-79 specific-like [Phymastichus coffea]|uniref:histone-lysine N-methyltransferase, H3 lysine-79 specific-like n=1 Tax=Phymastichus coffea TaxID=108790 RepID=UPI00273B0BF5|nr:histone-lysine N-methyltransferase, H3 lysine-79 specific-like [Phymastichus coffea]